MLECEEKNCNYNRNEFCIKKAIAINEQSRCVSFERKKLNAKFDFEFSMDLVSAKTPSPQIRCNDQECIHNVDRACSAKSVQIGRSSFRPVHCRTFKNKS